MVARSRDIARPPERDLYETPLDQQYIIIANFSFWCLKHPQQVMSLNQAQIDLINKYPVSKHRVKDMNLYNRKYRRSMRGKIRK